MRESVCFYGQAIENQPDANEGECMLFIDRQLK
jgi:hypothetical protein